MSCWQVSTPEQHVASEGEDEEAEAKEPAEIGEAREAVQDAEDLVDEVEDCADPVEDAADGAEDPDDSEVERVEEAAAAAGTCRAERAVRGRDCRPVARDLGGGASDVDCSDCCAVESEYEGEYEGECDDGDERAGHGQAGWLLPCP